MERGPVSVFTRFRAYQLGEKGSSFSFFAKDHFTLIEARITDKNEPRLRQELAYCGRSYIDCLHITSWDNDHCGEQDLEWILSNLAPRKIEYPGYDPHTDCGKNCLGLITAYQQRSKAKGSAVVAQRVDPTYIRSLSTAAQIGYRDVFYHPKQYYDGSNDNSTVKLFRVGMFNVASLGDIEHANIGSMLRACRIFKSEIDVMILAHHGSSNGVTTKKFLETVRPTVAICSSNYDNQHDHPKQEVRDLLFELDIRLYTTKTGDVIISSQEPHRSHYQVVNLQTDSDGVSSVKTFIAKKSRLLTMNADTLRARANPGPRGPR
jgi:competence protein ComEC